MGKGNGLIDFQPKNFNINSIKINKRTIPNNNILIDKDENKETLKIRDYVNPPPKRVILTSIIIIEDQDKINVQ